MAITFSNASDLPIADLDPAATGPLTGSLVALAGIALDNVPGGRAALITASANIHATTGSLVLIQIYDAVSSTVLAQTEVTFNGVGAADDYRCLFAQASVFVPDLSTNRSHFYGFELLAQVTGGSAVAIGGGLSVVASIGTRSPV